MKALQKLIIREVATRYPHDTDFYNSHGMNAGRWAEFKAGRTDIANVKYERVKGMIDSLFTPYEMDLLDEATKNKMFGKAKNVLDEYDRLRRVAVENMGENMTAQFLPTLYGGSQSENRMVIKHSEFPYIKVNVGRIPAPAGKRERREYILAHLEDLQ